MVGIVYGSICHNEKGQAERIALWDIFDAIFLMTN